VLVNRSGEPLMQALRRDTAQPGQAISAVLPPDALRASIKPEQLIALAGPAPARA
jgi:hypothetical protein